MFALPARRVSLIIAGILLLTTGVVFGDTYPRRRIGVSALYNPASHGSRSFPVVPQPYYAVSLNERFGLEAGLTVVGTMKTGQEMTQERVREVLLPVNVIWSFGRHRSKYETGTGLAFSYQRNLSRSTEYLTYPSQRVGLYPDFLRLGYRWRPTGAVRSVGTRLWLMIDYDFFPPAPFRPYVTVDIGYQF